MSEPPIRLIPATPSLFDWAMQRPGAAHEKDDLRLPSEGIESPAVLSWIQRTSLAVTEATGLPAAWFIACGNEVVGILSFKDSPKSGVVEIGYGVAAAFRGRGYATAAVGLLVVEAAGRGLDVSAETHRTNRASQIVLERNGFRVLGERIDAEEGALLLWRRNR